MRVPRVRSTVRRMAVVIGVLAVGGMGLLALRWYAYRAVMRGEMVYNAEMEQLHKDHERRLRGEIARLRRAESDGEEGAEATDRLFELLRVSAVAASSREVDTWERAPHSAGRTAVALKWADVAANEAGYMAELHERWSRDYERDLPPHHITDLEVKPFQMSDGWTQDDWKWSHAERTE